MSHLDFVSLYRRAVEGGLSKTELAKKIGCHPTTIENRRMAINNHFGGNVLEKLPSKQGKGTRLKARGRRACAEPAPQILSQACKPRKLEEPRNNQQQSLRLVVEQDKPVSRHAGTHTCFDSFEIFVTHG